MTPATVRTMKRAGFDWLWLDNEHSPHSYETIHEVIRCADDVQMITLVRVAELEKARIAQALDMNPSGIIVPRVETPDQVKRLVEYAKYPPVGKRGFGMRPALFGANRMSMAERHKDQNERILIFQVETPSGVANIEAMIDAADGQVDAVFFGPADFQITTGRLDNVLDPELDAAARRLTAVCAERGLSNGTPVTSMEAARLWMDRGFNLLTYLSDDGFMSLYAEECREQLKQFE